MKPLYISAIFLATALLLGGCSKQPSVSAPADNPQSTGEVTLPAVSAHTPDVAPVSTAAGLTWTVPSSWKTGPQKQMRLATYISTNGAECGVFFFGANEGGDDEANIDRWIGQFTGPDGSSAKGAKKGSQQVNGIKVLTLDVSGTYLNPGGPMMTAGEPLKNARMLAAIARGPEGKVFFKLVGEKQRVTAEEANFHSLLKSLRKTP
jgi:hypothetical protein